MARDETRLPLWAVALLERLIPIRQRGVVLGDFAEAFQWRAEEAGRRRALWWFWAQVIQSLPAFFLDGFYFGSVMFRSYLTVAVRNLRKRLFFSSLNIGGLAIGMAACLLIFQYVAFEYSFDDFHEHQEDLHRVVFKRTPASGTSYEATTWFALGPAAQAEIPEVIDYVRVHPNYGPATVSITQPNGERQAYREEGLIYADASLFRVFSFPLVRGQARTALTEPDGLLLSASTADRYFGQADPIGQEVEVRGWVRGTFRVAGVFADVPAASHLQFDLVVPMTPLLASGQYEDASGWGWTNFITYFHLEPGTGPQVTEKLTALAHARPELDDDERMGTEILLQPMADIHLRSTDYATTASVEGNYQTVYFLTVVAVFILLIAWINYINLSTARAMERAKEVGVRKAAGARRQQLISQFLFESALMNGLALALALGLAALLTPYLGSIIGVDLPLTIWQDPWFWGVFLGLFALGAVLASAYPALLLSSFQPVEVLKGTLGGGSTKAGLRKALVVFQFAASIALLTGTYAVYQQVQHLRGVDLGLAAEQIVTFSGPRIYAEGTEPADTRRVFFDELHQIPGIAASTRSTSVPGQGFSFGGTAKRYGADEATRFEMNLTWVRPDFFEAYGLTLAAGRFFSDDYATDADTALVVNEAMVRALGYTSNAEAVGQTITVAGNYNKIIVGVFEDVYWGSTAEEIQPFGLDMTRGGGMYSARLQTAGVQETLVALEALYRKHFPGNPYSYRFVDDLFQEQHEADQRFGMLFAIFAVFALIVACLGLVGLAAYTASLRTREIGVRKVLGASVPNIVRLLIRDFALLLVIALALTAVPMYFALDAWLSGFAERITLTPDLFFVPGLVVFAFALLTVSYHTLRSAILDPAQALRYA